MKKIAVFILALLFVIHGTAIAEEAPAKPTNPQALSSFSGTVVDVNEKPVAGFVFAVIPMHLNNGHMEPVDASLIGEIFGRIGRILSPNRDKDGEENKRLPGTVETGEDGKFSIPRISPGFVQLMIQPNIPGGDKSDKKILSVQFGPITVFENRGEFGPGMDDRLTFALPAGVPVKDVKITVMQRLRIHAQIVYADGTPIANTNVSFHMKVKSEHGNSSIGTSVSTNADGYFTRYMDNPGVYTISAEHKGLSGGATPFQLDEKQAAPENLVIKLDGNPHVPEKGAVRKPGLTPDGKPVDVKAIPREIFVPEQGEFVPLVTPEDIEARKKAQQKKELEKSVWVVNPANGHAYKKIPCTNWHDAQKTAIKEGAHLVSINNRAEQLWIQVIFGHQPFWIGLNDVEKEGVWQWDSGEPVTFTNWTDHEVFGGSSQPDSEKDYVAMTFHFGAWQAVAPSNRDGRGHSPLWHITRHAIIEKDGLISKVPEPADTTEEEE